MIIALCSLQLLHNHWPVAHSASAGEHSYDDQLPVYCSGFYSEFAGCFQSAVKPGQTPKTGTVPEKRGLVTTVNSKTYKKNIRTYVN